MSAEYRCHLCGARFDEPIATAYREDVNGEGAYQTFYIDRCPDCGSEEIDEFENFTRRNVTMNEPNAKNTNPAAEKAEPYYIVRADRAGVFFGHVKARSGSEVTMTGVRRLWYWSGAASLSQMAVEGVSCPHDCKFTVTVPEMTILGAIEIIPCSEAAASCILEVPEWRA
jgi:DNA-directed RNA polymerase subunit RPC12/RpoP